MPSLRFPSHPAPPCDIPCGVINMQAKYSIMKNDLAAWLSPPAGHASYTQYVTISRRGNIKRSSLFALALRSSICHKLSRYGYGIQC